MQRPTVKREFRAPEDVEREEEEERNGEEEAEEWSQCCCRQQAEGSRSKKAQLILSHAAITEFEIIGARGRVARFLRASIA